MKNQIKEEIDKIKIPPELHQRSELGIKKIKSNKFFTQRGHMRKYIGITAAVILCLGVLTFSNTGLANSIHGFFKDKKSWNGTVTGTEYENATHDIDIKIGKQYNSDDILVFPVTVTFKNANIPPYNLTEALTVNQFKVIKNNDTSINLDQIQWKPTKKEHFNFDIKDNEKLLTEDSNYQSSERIFKGDILISKSTVKSNDNLTLVISSMLEQSAANAPLEIKGNWEVELK